ncbi:glycosyltransferase family 2 protein [Clostridia bacterium]|nr:glycosyltransferase family 2 protein [Clostridia bacterium]
MSEEIYMSIILPAYNEENRLGPTLTQIIAYLDGKDWQAEIIVVDDGSTDKTVDLVKGWVKKDARIRLVRNPENKGKGFSVRNGMLHAKGRYRLFSDSDLSTPIEELDKLLDNSIKGADVSIGSRSIEGSDVQVAQAFYRVFMGRTFNLLVRLLFHTKMRDTQCGFKLFSKEAVEDIFPKAVINRFGFDVEVLFLAEQLGYTVQEVPIVWINSEETKVSAIRDSIDMFIDLFRIRMRLRKSVPWKNR